MGGCACEEKLLTAESAEKRSGGRKSSIPISESDFEVGSQLNLAVSLRNATNAVTYLLSIA